jgi:RNA polymerase sigma-70 factor (ECF subfamily)
LTEAFNIAKLTDQLFRHEAGKMVAVLTKIFGTENLQLSEDTVQETFIMVAERHPGQPFCLVVSCSKKQGN